MNTQPSLLEAPEDFSTEVSRINLRRIAWFLTAVLLLNAVVFTLCSTLPPSELARPNPASDFDTIVSLTLLGISLVLYWARGFSFWRQAFIMVFLVIQLITVDFYYFTLLPEAGPTAVYLITVICLGMILLMPSLLFAGIVIANHLFFSTLLLQSQLEPKVLSAAMIDGMVGVVLCCLGQYFLYSGKQKDFAQRKALRERNEELDELMAIAAHDLRSPLQSMKNLYEISSPRPEWQAESHRQVISESINVCNKMLSLVGRILEAYAFERGEKKIATHSQDIKPLILSIRQRHQTQAYARQITLRLEMPEQKLMATINQGVFEQALDNLVTNAIKFSPCGSTVTISAARRHEELHVDVRDEGPGISGSEIEMLFQKFHRGHHERADNETSLGLGLFITRKLMESMDGSVRYIPAAPTGSRFQLRVPSGKA